MATTHRLHIVCFDNPFPPVYGGVIDVFYKIKALHAIGFEIYLHCFVDKPSVVDAALAPFVRQVFFYRRYKKRSFFKLVSGYPFAAASRDHSDLFPNLSAIEAPVLFEGLQTTFVLSRHEFKDRPLFLRLHNLEANYFAGLQKSETGWIKKQLYRLEALRYEPYQQIMARFTAVFTLSVYETGYVQQHFGNAHYIPVFHGNEPKDSLSQFGKYALYHGDLRMADNKRAVDFLIRVFRKIPDYPLVIASGCNAAYVNEKISGAANISYVAIESQQHLAQILADAHINVMLSFQESGTKLKLVNALHQSRFCIINSNMVDDERLRQLCVMAETESDFIDAVKQLKSSPYAESENRRQVLQSVLDDRRNAQKIKEIIVG